MTSDFIWKECQGFKVLQFKPWSDRGITHGFTDMGLNFRPATYAESEARLKREFNLSAIVAPEQVHGTKAVDLRNSETLKTVLTKTVSKEALIADSVIAPVTLPTANLAIAIQTADCVPLIVLSSNGYAVIHAGWRGLADEIIEAVLTKLGSSTLEVLIGPCAGGKRYEVGSEVIEAIGDSAHFKPGAAAGKFLLDGAKTAENQILRISPSSKVHRADLCTISSTNLHSYRRDGSVARGSSLCFVRIPTE